VVVRAVTSAEVGENRSSRQLMPIHEGAAHETRAAYANNVVATLLVWSYKTRPEFETKRSHKSIGTY
jgi:hypothetical protein